MKDFFIGFVSTFIIFPLVVYVLHKIKPSPQIAAASLAATLPIQKKRDFWWLYSCGGQDKFDKNGRINFDVLWDFGTKMYWGVGGACDRDNLKDIISDNLYEDERVIIITATLINIKDKEYRKGVAIWISSTIQKKERGYFKADSFKSGEYNVN